MHYKLIAVDLDGTLLTPDKRVSLRTRRALEHAQRCGAAIVVATGRGFGVLREFCRDLPLGAPQITYNGAIIVDPIRNENISSYLVPADHVRPVLDFLVDVAAPAAFFSPLALYMDRCIPNPLGWSPPPLDPPRLLDDVRAVGNEPCIKIAAWGDATAIARIRPIAEQRFGSRLYVTQTARDLLEFLHPDVSKGAALRRIAHMLHIPREHVIAFGDSHNDVDMLEFAGTGVAMGNASCEVKAIADHVTASNEDDGVAEALEHLVTVAIP